MLTVVSLRGLKPGCPEDGLRGRLVPWLSVCWLASYFCGVKDPSLPAEVVGKDSDCRAALSCGSGHCIKHGPRSRKHLLTQAQ